MPTQLKDGHQFAGPDSARAALSFPNSTAALPEAGATALLLSWGSSELSRNSLDCIPISQGAAIRQADAPQREYRLGGVVCVGVGVVVELEGPPSRRELRSAD